MARPLRGLIRLAVSISAGLLLTLGILALTSRRTTATTYNYPACGAMQACIDAAADGDVINIASGTYTESFTLNKAVSLIGAGSSATTLTAVSNQRVLTVTGASISHTVVISGMKLIAPGPGGSSSIAGHGGGLYIGSSAQPLLTNLDIRNFIADGNGGGLYAEASSPLQISNVVFWNNFASGNGGGAYLNAPSTLADVTFQYNYGNISGGGLYATEFITLTNPIFLQNTSDPTAGAFYATGGLIAGGVFTGNSTISGPGGAVVSQGHLTITATRFITNRAGTDGGALYLLTGTVRATNTLFDQNVSQWFTSSPADGAAIYLTGTGTLELVHGTIGGRLFTPKSAIVNNGYTAFITNSIIVSHSVAISHGAGTTTQNYNLFFGNTLSTTGTIGGHNGIVTGNPLFVNPAGHDYHLMAGSPAIDAGTAAGVATDFDGDARPQGVAPDLGYDEYPSGVVATATPTSTPSATATGAATATQTSTPSPAATGAATSTPTSTPTPTATTPPGLIPGFRNVATTGTDTGTCLAAFCRTMAYALKQVQAVTETVYVAAGTYSETVVVTKTVTIRGAGAAATIMDTAGKSRPFEIAQGVSVTLQAVHIHSGTAEYGGGILNRGTLTLHSVAVEGNEATAAGGGVYNLGALTVRQSAIVNNRAVFGGGLYNLGTLTLENVTLSGNQANVDGGGLFDYRGNFHMGYSTVADNQGGTSQAGQGGGVFVITNTAPITVAASIIAGNSMEQTNSEATTDCNLALASAGYNLTANGTGCGFAGGTGNVNTTGIFSTVLAPLAPYVNDMFAHALLLNSPALNVIPTGANGCGSAPTVDQRGAARPTGANCDIGAFESVPDTALSGLGVSSSSPAILGSAVMFTASVASGSNPAYGWDFGDGETGVGVTVSHNYARLGLYTATVKASNGANDLTASLTASVRLPNADLGFQPSAHGYGFASQSASAHPQTATIIEMLGVEQACDLSKPVFTTTTPVSCTLSPVLSQTVGGKSIGQAYGLAVTSLRFFKNLDTPGAIVPGAASVPALAHTAALADHVARYSYQQLTRPISPTASPWERNLPAAEALQRLHDGLTLQLSGDDAYLMTLPVAGQGRSHTVVPYKLTYLNDESYALGIYDPYFPLDNARQVLFDLAAGTWAYTTTVPGTGAVLDLGSQSAASRIDLRRLSTHRPSGLTLAHASGLPAEYIRTLQTIGLANGPMAFVTGNCFSAPGLNHAPDANGRCDAPLPNSGPIQCLLVDMAPAGQVCATRSVTPTAGLVLHPSAGGAVGFDLLTEAGTSASLAATASTTDTVALNLSPDARQIAITSTGALSSTRVTLVVQSASGSSPGYVVTLIGPALGAGSAFSATVNETTGQLTFGDTDSRTLSYDIRLERLNPDGTTSTFQAYDVDLSDDGATADFGNWDGSGAINFTFGGSGTPKPIPNQAYRLFMPLVRR